MRIGPETVLEVERNVVQGVEAEEEGEARGEGRGSALTRTTRRASQSEQVEYLRVLGAVCVILPEPQKRSLSAWRRTARTFMMAKRFPSRRGALRLRTSTKMWLNRSHMNCPGGLTTASAKKEKDVRRDSPKKKKAKVEAVSGDDFLEEAKKQADNERAVEGERIVRM